MAENKKSFILYCDQKGLWDKLDDAQAGKLIKHIIAYVNDENPIAPDFITELAFEPIKQQLKRDLLKWADIKVERSESGRLGGIKSGEARREKKQTEANEANASKSKQTEANEAVNVNVNVNDTVNNKKNMSTNVDGLDVTILEIIRSLKSGHTGSDTRAYKITPKRTRLVTNRKKDFDKLWPGRDFQKACQYAFRYKAKEWFGTDMWKHFEPETLLSEKFISYLEKAEQDKGEPYRAEPKVKGEEKEKVVYRIPADRT